MLLIAILRKLFVENSETFSQIRIVFDA